METEKKLMGKGTMFVSFRSPSYDELTMNNCVLQKGKECKRGNVAFSECKFEGCTYRRAVKFAMKLAKEGKISGWYIMPPQAMLPKYTAMKPVDFMELLLPLYQNTQDSDFFVRFCIGERGDSFWTLLERDVWRRHRSERKLSPIEYSVELDKDGEYLISEPIELPIMSKEMIKVYTRIKVYIIPAPMSSGHFWGRYARTCFVIQCQTCGNVFGVSNGAFTLLNQINKRLECPFCQKGEFLFKTVKDNSKKYPCRYEFTGQVNKVSPITPDFIINLLLDDNKNVPVNFPIFCINGEKFPTDSEITLKAMVFPILIGERLFDAALHRLNISGNKLIIRFMDRNNKFVEGEYTKLR